jgi:transposase, IS5 family
VTAQLREDYKRLIELTEQVVRQAREAREILPPGESTGRQVRETLETFIPRVERVITQARRRVLVGRPLPAPEKLVSIFEPHTAIIRKGKLGHPVEFGRVLWLDETEGGIVSRYAVLPGNPDDAQQVVPSLEHHIGRFGRAPRLLTGDRKVSSPDGERSAQDRGVHHVVLPHAGRRSRERRVYEQQRWFQRGRRWRAGIEGRISVLKRRHKLARCLYHGSDGMERWVGWGVLAHNLLKIAEAAG